MVMRWATRSRISRCSGPAARSTSCAAMRATTSFTPAVSRTGCMAGRDDMLHGEAGADAFYGGMGADTMTGGDDAGGAPFIYFNAAETGAGAGNRDVITDFATGEDRIELGRIDADITQGFKQAFAFIGAAGFSGLAGELRYTQAGGSTIVQADRDGDGVADMEIELTGAINLVADDFLI
ncbi:MAG: M10 family metallopeptidase C-terminal domain-containing protein [Roseovarius sp.]